MVGYILATMVYNIYFHPLSHIPGPLLARGSGLPYIIHIRNGTMIPWLQELHQQYGDAVRVAPSEISFISGETAWQDIYGFHTGKNRKGPYLKDQTWLAKPVNNVYPIINAGEADHARGRRNLSHAFSDKALREQEGIFLFWASLIQSASFCVPLRSMLQLSNTAYPVTRGREKVAPPTTQISMPSTTYCGLT